MNEQDSTTMNPTEPGTPPWIRPWFKLPTDWATDPKIAEMKPCMQVRHIQLMCLHARGCRDLSEPEIAKFMGISPKSLAKTKDIFLQKGFIDHNWTLLGWDSQQQLDRSQDPKSQSRRLAMTPAERKRKSRLAMRTAAENEAATAHSALEEDAPQSREVTEDVTKLVPSVTDQNVTGHEECHEEEDLDIEEEKAASVTIVTSRSRNVTPILPAQQSRSYPPPRGTNSPPHSRPTQLSWSDRKAVDRSAMIDASKERVKAELKAARKYPPQSAEQPTPLRAGTAQTG